MPACAVGIDLGGTNLRAALVNREGCILVRRSMPIEVDRGPRGVIEQMVRLVRRLCEHNSQPLGELSGIGVGAPGPLDLRRGRIIHSPNLAGWIDVALRDELAAALGVSVVLDNDGNAAAFGEYWARSPDEREDLVLLTLGTGVGAGVVLDGRIVHGHFGNAAELGHMIVEPGGLPCGCGQRGCLEQYASAKAVASRVTAAIQQGEPSLLTKKYERIDSIDAEAVASAAADDDGLCLRIWNDACRALAVAVINIQHAFNPKRVLLGGGMSKAGKFLVDPVRASVNELRWSMHDDVPVVDIARLGEDAGLVGAAALITERITA